MTGKGRREKGKLFEQLTAQRYRAAGYGNCKTARSVSGGYQEGCDLLGLPWKIECKAQENFSVRQAAGYVKAGVPVVHCRLNRLPEVVVVDAELWWELINVNTSTEIKRDLVQAWLAEKELAQ